MKRIVRALATAALAASTAALFAGIAAGSSPATIRMNDNGPNGGRFAPAEAETTIRKGGPEALWRFAPYTNAPHDVVEDKGLFESPGNAGIDSSYKVQLSAGSYPYYCSFHGLPGRGMHGTVGVTPQVKQLSKRRFKVTWATADSTSGDRYDVQWRAKGSKKWRTWKRATKGLGSTFGADGSPVDVKPGKGYELRVRSREDGNPTRKSDWSPTTALR